MQIPTVQDWGPVRDDDVWARKVYMGRSIDDLHAHFLDNAVSAAEDLIEMREIPFRYYIYGFKNALESAAADPDCEYPPEMAMSSIFFVLEHTLRYDSAKIWPILDEWLEIAKNLYESLADPDEESFGTASYRLRWKEIIRLKQLAEKHALEAKKQSKKPICD